MMGGIHTQKLTTNDALSYLKAVKEMFPDRRDKYDEFLDVMKDFKSQRLDTSGVIARVKELFKGHRHLILGFNTFLPKGYEIVLPPDNESHAAGKKPIDFNEAINFVNKIKARFQGDDQVYKSFLDILNLYRKENKSIQEVYREVASLFCDHRDLLVEFTHFLPDYSAEASVRHAQSARNSTMVRDGRGPPMSMARIRNVDKKASVSHVNHDLAGNWTDRRREKLLMRTDKEHQRLVKDERMQDRGEDLFAELFCKGKHDQELAFFEKVKDRLELDDYQEFIKCLHIYKNNQVTDSQLRNLVFNILKDSPDLVEEFDKFKTQFDKLDAKYRDIYDRDNDGSDEGLGFSSKDIVGQRTSLWSSKDKYFMKPIQELDLSHCESCTPSYRLLPNNYPIPLASQRTKMGSEVLNDHWVSVTSGSEDYSFKHMRRNQYEESLFRCEDDMFDLDMLLASVNSTASRVEEVLEKSDNDSSPICVEDHFTVLNLRCIERLYGEHGLDVLDVLRKNASLALPVILTRLKQKQEEWTKCRSDFNKVWGEIYANNYHKSLDHRSFYFKQQDAKSLSTKVVLDEIKEISDNRSQEDGMLQCFVTGKRPPLIPHLEFEYPDPVIHNDLYKLIKCACQRGGTSEQLNEVIKIWTTFLEPMLGVASRSRGLEDIEDIVHSISSNNGSVSAGNGDESIPHGASVEPKTDNLCNTQPEKTALNVTSMADLAAGLITGPQENVVVDMENVISGLSTPVRPCNDNANGGLETKNINDSQGDECTRPASSVAEVKMEREEGELSPNNSDFEEDNFTACGDTSNESAGNNAKGVSGNGQHQMETGENDANARDECEEDSGGHRLSEEDSENNASENEDASGRESADREPYPLEAQDGTEAFQPFSEPFLQTAKPVTRWISQSLNRDHDSHIFYGNDSFYAIFRLHHILYERIQKAKLYSSTAENKRRNANDNSSLDTYAKFMNALHSLLNGSSDNSKFEDDCRAIIGTQSYILFTLDKLILKLVRQVQNLAIDDMSTKLLQLHEYERSRKPETFIDYCYGENAHVLLYDHNIYRIEWIPETTRLSIQMMDYYWLEKADANAVSVEPNFADYMTELLALAPERQEKSRLFLKRNMQKYGDLDESRAFMEAAEGLVLFNGLEIKISCTSFKASYVLGSEDVLMRRKRRKILHRNGQVSLNGVFMNK